MWWKVFAYDAAIRQRGTLVDWSSRVNFHIYE
jgi:hypothetical protein